MSQSIYNDWAVEFEDWKFLNSIDDVPKELAYLARDNGTQTLDPRKVLKTENQRNMGSCRGHSGSTGTEWLRTLATGEIGFQLSRMMMYVETQRIDGIRSDSGSTIAGGLKLLENVGLCREELWPYPSQYSQERPANWQAVLDDAAPHRIGRKQRCRTYGDVAAWAGTGQGYIDIGIPWRQEYSAPVVDVYRGGGGGFHAIALFTLSDRKDRSGRNYIWMLNSHGLNSGQQGWSEYSPSFIEGCLTHDGTVMIGVSDMPHMKGRELNAEEWKKGLRV
jgi:hypothetical protein